MILKKPARATKQKVDVEEGRRQAGQEPVEEVALERLGDDEEVDRAEGNGGQQSEEDPEKNEHPDVSVYQNARRTVNRRTSRKETGARPGRGRAGRRGGTAPYILAMEAVSSPASSSDSSSMPRSLAVPS